MLQEAVITLKGGQPGGQRRHSSGLESPVRDGAGSSSPLRDSGSGGGSFGGSFSPRAPPSPARSSTGIPSFQPQARPPAAGTRRALPPHPRPRGLPAGAQAPLTAHSLSRQRSPLHSFGQTPARLGTPDLRAPQATQLTGGLPQLCARPRPASIAASKRRVHKLALTCTARVPRTQQPFALANLVTVSDWHAHGLHQPLRWRRIVGRQPLLAPLNTAEQCVVSRRGRVSLSLLVASA